jgi:hypothetical protein
LQGPFENAVHLWGSDIFYAVYDEPDYLRDLLDVLGQTWVLAVRKFAEVSTEAAQDDFVYLHFTIVKGRVVLKEDSTMLLSPQQYAEFIRPVNEVALGALGTGGIHWCGKADRRRSQVVETRGLSCIDLGNPDMIDLPTWAVTLKERRLSVGKMGWEAEKFSEVAPAQFFPTGASFTVTVDGVEQARRMMGDQNQ